MYLIVGLGNPGRDYVGTRHNIGFEAADAICAKFDIRLGKEKFRAVFGEGRIGGERAVVAKPQTFMNLSGESVREMRDWYKLDESHIIVIYDDISLPVGKLRIREKGSAGGHNGIKNIIANLGTDVFPRIKIGVGEKPKKYDLADYVLGHFSKEDRELMEEGYDRADHAVGMILNGEIEAAMNQYNRKVKPKEA